ncbi:hypothetical protein [Flavobacterium geliluteum]|uniref:Uncharacterized protein n=1 Tax=Flavobacterium geliluteum TaxID=2816120 RepID=A0A941AYI3_9FLAO|nr:hypothetical protein [Flavobacterium geliluteum]MBP4139406.1 hypothetical protein [Flavobacterium geliluteum]
MALYLLNCSVDTSDFNSNFVAENLSLNDQESIIELVVEKVLGYQNAIPEIDDCDSDNHTILKKIVALDFFTLPFFNMNINPFEHTSKTKTTCFTNSYPLKTYLEIHSPPPEV